MPGVVQCADIIGWYGCFVYNNYYCIAVSDDELERCCVSADLDPVAEAYIYNDEVTQLYRAISKLLPIQRKRIQMVLSEIDYKEIARQEGRDLSVIYRSIEKALKNLRHLMNE